MKKRLFDRLAALAAAAVILLAAVPGAWAAEEDGKAAFTQEEQAYIDSRGPLKVGYVQDRIPISFTGEDGQLAGISRYILDRVSQLSGLEFEYVALPGGSVTYDYLLGEGFDLVTSVEYNEENKHANGILISNPYLSSRKVVVARKDLNFRPDAALTVAISTGSQTIEKVLKNVFPNFTLENYATTSDCFDAVRNGMADLTIQNQFVAEYWLYKPAYEKLKAMPVLGMADEMCFSAVVAFGGGGGTSQEEGAMLIGILDKAIACLSEDEQASYIIQGVMENQYTFTLTDFLYRYRYAVLVLAVSSVVILVLAGLLVRLRIRSTQARADAKAKGQFLSTMSHEIRTPLNGLIGLNYLMSQKLDDRERLDGYLRQSTATAKYLLSLVNDILDMSRLQAEKMELVHRPVDLELLVSTVDAIVRTSMSDKGLEFRVESELPWPCVLGDEVRIQQVLLNLLDNARKFTPAGGQVDLKIRQEQVKSGAVVTTAQVSDNGRGMSEEFQKHIFDSFAQELDTVSKGNQGTGLGLPISRSLARLMGGDLTFVSRKGEGSVFTFTFAALPTELPREEDIRTEPSPAARPHILVAEDNELNGEIILELLEGEGFTADLAVNGRQAVEMFAASAPGTFGVVLMDLLMPEMDGFEAARAIRDLDRPDAKTVRIFACTANSFSTDRDRALESGMDDFISKPIDIQELFRKLEK